MITAYASLETAIVGHQARRLRLPAPSRSPPRSCKAAVRKGCRHLVLQREARRLAAERRQIRFQFLSVLAHELKAPLAAIEGYLNILQDHALGDEVSAYDRADPALAACASTACAS